MFWLPYAMIRNRNFANTTMDITRDTNWLLKIKGGVTCTHFSSWAIPYCNARTHCSMSTLPPPLHHTAQYTTQPMLTLEITELKSYSIQTGNLKANRVQTPACWKKCEGGKKHHTILRDQGELLESFLHFTKPLKCVELSTEARI